ncbi:hypothetical protein ACFL3G_07050 [Planctomycetota bacterium]
MTPQNDISVIEPISVAIDKTKTILFKPFDLGKWFTIGFCAWLTQIGRSGFNFPTHFTNPGTHHHFKEFFISNAVWLIPLFVTGFVVTIAIMITLLWLNSRGRFMFLHCVALNKAQVKIPWEKFKNQANSLFLFRLIANIIFVVSIAVFTGLTIFFVVLITKNNIVVKFPLLFAFIFIVIVTVALAIAFVLFLKFTNDFVTPLMYLRSCSCIEAWREFLGMLTANKANFTLYLLFQMVISAAFGIIVAALVLATCCCAGLFLAIPYIGTVVVLPLLIFYRAYSLCYIRQFGPQFDVFQTQTPQIDSPLSV